MILNCLLFALRPIWKSVITVQDLDESRILVCTRTVPRLHPSSWRCASKAMAWPTEFSCLIVFSDSLLCVNGINKWMDIWEADEWTRMGHPLENTDL